MCGTDSKEWGWCQGTLKLMKGEFAVVDFAGTTDIISIDRIRNKNKKFGNFLKILHSSVHKIVYKNNFSYFFIFQSSYH